MSSVDQKATNLEKPLHVLHWGVDLFCPPSWIALFWWNYTKLFELIRGQTTITLTFIMFSFFLISTPTFEDTMGKNKRHGNEIIMCLLARSWCRFIDFCPSERLSVVTNHCSRLVLLQLCMHGSVQDRHLGRWTILEGPREAGPKEAGPRQAGERYSQVGGWCSWRTQTGGRRR